MIQKLKRISSQFTLLKWLVKKELKSKSKLSFNKRVSLWKKGFLSESYTMYSLGTNDAVDYLSDYARYLKTFFIDEKYSDILDNKILFTKVLSKFQNYLPESYAMLDRNSIIPLNKENICTLSRLIEFTRQKAVVLKPIKGGGGRGILILKSKGNEISINGDSMPKEKLIAKLSELREYYASEYIFQANYSKKIFGATNNTIRILTMWDYEKNEPFIAAATHRFGEANSKVVDNWSQGGLCAGVDIKIGELRKAGVYVKKEDKLYFYDCHPDTKSPINGVKIPHWNLIKTELLEIAKYLSIAPYIGWDILVTEDGFKILEGNKYSGVGILQIYTPLLKDKRIRNFYEKFGIIRKI